MIRLIKELDGKILDMGGGGEGVIGRLPLTIVKRNWTKRREDMRKYAWMPRTCHLPMLLFGM